MILDCIIRPAPDYLRYLSPLVAESLMSLDKLHFFDVAPLFLVDRWIQVVVPPIK
jgi:hypothetical protein